MAEINNHKKIIIIGAGAAGLAIAHGLNRAGIPYVIYERAESGYSKRNWTFGLHWGYDALKELVPEQLLARVFSALVDPSVPPTDSDKVIVQNGQTGELLQALVSKKLFRLRRDRFRNLLLEDLQVQWNKKLDRITYSADGQTITAHFEDGSSDTGLAIVGCDGAHSAVRTNLVGSKNAELDPIGYTAAIMFSRYSAEQAKAIRSSMLHPVLQTAAHPNGHFAFMSMQEADEPDHPENWLFSSYISYPNGAHPTVKTREEWLAQQKAIATTFVDPIRSLYAWAPEDSHIEALQMQNWDPRLPNHQWDSHNGRVTLAGDSAHAMTFQRGQGLNNAMQDALTFVQAATKWWGKESEGELRAKAITDYEAEMKARAGAEVQLSKEWSDLFHNEFDKILSGEGQKQGMMPTEKDA